jgi:hypothetical protein
MKDDKYFGLTYCIINVCVGTGMGNYQIGALHRI